MHALPPPPHEVTLSPGRHTPAEQHPLGHDVPSQTQVLPTQRCPGAHVAPVPHRQSPVAEQLSARASQAMQLEPALPQAETERLEQVVPLQQPLGHEVPSQMQRPLSQRWPPAQAAAEPHAQLPSAAQWSALDGSQALQTPPLAPQVPSEGELHTLPLQQPVAHEVVSHTHAPPRQRCPFAHGGPLPQVQAPLVEQVSALVASQALHAAAPVPHVLSERG